MVIKRAEKHTLKEKIKKEIFRLKYFSLIKIVKNIVTPMMAAIDEPRANPE